MTEEQSVCFDDTKSWGKWEEFRNQAAVSTMQAIIGLQNPKGCANFDRIADLSVQAANALVKRLRN